MTKDQINALFGLLDDPSEEVCNEVIRHFSSLGTNIVPLLIKFYHQSDNPLIHSRTKIIIDNINFGSVIRELQHWKQKPDKLFSLLIIIAKINSPNINIIEIEDKCNKIAQKISIELSHNLTAIEKVSIINYHIFTQEKITIIPNKEQEPSDFMIDCFFEKKRCSSFFITLFYLVICRKVGFAIYPINVPGNRILAFLNQSYFIDSLVRSDSVPALFYIEPIHQGIIIDHANLNKALSERGFSLSSQMLNPVSNLILLRTLAKELALTYKTRNELEKAESFENLSSDIQISEFNE